ncbi:BrnT family toxin [Aquiflexum sp. LQ15W]|uniref:BrnT family toxin n=1 Tax=Cognataquiflexum nitidum TaxID=2922272 RepID=UPI001F12B0FB|nr:BrnT family toxin [Cognataquiflexum nitidum]MCH6200294.1 BrnT family toxin [Cognataquiflexum nitidum]
MFEFDHYKSELNRIKHGIDFNQAQLLWDDPNRIVIPAKTVDEKRYLLIAKFNQSIWSAIFTIRKDMTRIISVRKSRENERAIYYSS